MPNPIFVSCDTDRAEAIRRGRERRSRPPRFYTKEQLEALYRQSRFGPVWKLLANTGLRPEEALKLIWGDIKELHIEVKGDPNARIRSQRRRGVALTERARHALDNLKNHTTPVPFNDLKTMTKAFRNDAARAGVGGTLYRLRQTYCARMVIDGIPLVLVHALVGYPLFQMTRRYAPLGPRPT